MDLKLLLLFVIALAALAKAEDFEHEPEDQKDNQLDAEGKVYIDRYGYRRPLNLQIRVPFFQMYLRRQKAGPSKLGLQVFPSEHGSLVDIDHRWWGKK